MGPPRKRHTGRNILLAALLAVLCVGGAELMVCRVADPALYDKLTAPAVSFLREVWEQAGRQADALARHAENAVRKLAALIPERPPEPVETPQISGDPAIVEDLTPADPTITEFQEEAGAEVLSGGNVLLTYYNQKDEAWAEASYGSDPIGLYGCGPTALSMLVSSLTEEDATPAEMAEWAASAGHWCRRSGSYLSIVEGAAKAYGLDCVSLPVTDPESLLSGLSTGGIAVALMGPGHFTKGGHFILLHGVTLSGGILVADPNSRDNSLVVWDPQLILDELSPSRTSGAPLWLLTVPPALEPEE